MVSGTRTDTTREADSGHAASRGRHSGVDGAVGASRGGDEVPGQYCWQRLGHALSKSNGGDLRLWRSIAGWTRPSANGPDLKHRLAGAACG
jgi:hypothetical protein